MIIGADSALAGLAAAAVHGIVLLPLFRLLKTVAPVKLHLASGFGWHLVGTGAGLALVPAFDYWTAAAVYWFCFMSYLYVYSAFSKSISLKILRNIVARPDLTISRAEIYRLYVLPSFTQRIEILVEGGLAHRQDRRFEITAAGRATTGRLRRLQRLFGIDRFGLYYTDPASVPVPIPVAAGDGRQIPEDPADGR